MSVMIIRVQMTPIALMQCTTCTNLAMPMR